MTSYLSLNTECEYFEEIIALFLQFYLSLCSEITGYHIPLKLRLASLSLIFIRKVKIKLIFSDGNL